MIDTFIKEINPEYTASLKQRETSFLVYVQMITKEEDIVSEPEPENVVCSNLRIDADALVDLLIALANDKRVNQVLIWDTIDGFNVSVKIVNTYEKK